MLAFILHIGGGTIGLASGLVAQFARKGGYLHRKAGNVFFVSMLVMAMFADYLAVTVPGQIVNLFIGSFALHVTSIFFLPQLLVLGFLIFWMIRVRFTGWR
jgi:hypothetical protein